MQILMHDDKHALSSAHALSDAHKPILVTHSGTAAALSARVAAGGAAGSPVRVLLERVIPPASSYLHSMSVCVCLCVLDLRL